jgi:lipopolysaccharide cholinephosphotransferase
LNQEIHSKSNINNPSSYQEKYNLVNHHNNLLSLLKDFHDFCELNDVVYTLDGGSLLGAIRHKGFIPWDDDADVSMTRDQFTKFKKALKNQSKIKIHYHLWIPRVYFRDTDLDNFIFLDLFIYDHVPKSEIMKFVKRNLILMLQGMMHNSYSPDGHHKTILRVALFVLWLFGRIIPFGLKLSLYSVISRVRLYRSKHVSVYNDTYKRIAIDRNVFDKNEFSNSIQIEFENTKFNIIQRYSGHLEKLFGDFMRLPPESMRKPEHFFTKNISIK